LLEEQPEEDARTSVPREKTMYDAREIEKHGDLDRLRVLGISRIPRCAECPRLPALAAAVRGSRPSAERLPAPPGGCRHEVCKPLILRYFPDKRIAARPLRLVEAGGGCC
jgi:hypothetical protein